MRHECVHLPKIDVLPARQPRTIFSSKPSISHPDSPKASPVRVIV